MAFRRNSLGRQVQVQATTTRALQVFTNITNEKMSVVELKERLNLLQPTDMLLVSLSRAKYKGNFPIGTGTSSNDVPNSTTSQFKPATSKIIRYPHKGSRIVGTRKGR